ncbi:hypothetical protein HZC07_05100 [Candidatus Micrarchaeota archaeon]|nr:hypothetical protein [Candidatus Micrarchaeota archaeon]
MEIISMSIDDETLQKLEKVQDKFGFKSRSKLLRATLNSLLNEYQVLDSLKGHSDAVFMITYKDNEKHKISDALHKFEDCIKTVIHQHHVGICLEVVIVCAEARRLRELFGLLKKEKSVKSVNCSVL